MKNASPLTVLITGGAGYIGSTVASACLDEGIRPILLDDLSLGRAEFTMGRDFVKGDIADGDTVDAVFAAYPDICATVHCAARAVVPDSVRDPLTYYRENVAKSISLFEHLQRNDCRRVVFSSSASIYGPGSDFSVDEDSLIAPASPYARTKYMIETVLQDLAAALGFDVFSLRYFNPIGADPQLRSGFQTSNSKRVLAKLIEAARDGSEFLITGTTWPTRDGSGIRDYVHVWDVANAHVLAIRQLTSRSSDGSFLAVNLGMGTGVTVRELIAEFERASGLTVRVRESEPRPGDVAGAFAKTERARRVLGWSVQRSLADAIADDLRWASRRNEIMSGG